MGKQWNIGDTVSIGRQEGKIIRSPSFNKNMLIKNIKKKLPMQSNKGSDDFQTPIEAVELIVQYIPNSWIIAEVAWGKGLLANHLRNMGYMVIGEENFDFLNYLKFLKQDSHYYYNYLKNCDCIVTNPPYSYKDQFIEMCYEIGIPFALLLPLTALEGKKRNYLFRTHGIQLIIPDKRFNFITPTGRSGKNSSSWFQTAWFTWKFNLPKDLNFVTIRG